MNYDKYLKYKTKYILLKQDLSQVGGTYKKLGAGNYGIVFTESDSSLYAYKLFVLNEQQNSQNYDNELSTLHYITENNLQDTISSPHIIQLSIFNSKFKLVKQKNYTGILNEYKTYQTLDNNSSIKKFIKNKPSIIFELKEEVKQKIKYVVIKMPKYKITLSKYLKELLVLEPNDENLLIKYVEIPNIILEKINIMIENNIYHFDLNLNNIMIDQNETVRIIDFGKSSVIENPEDITITDYITKYYLLYYISQYNNNKNIKKDTSFITFSSPGPSLIYSDIYTQNLQFAHTYEPIYVTYYNMTINITKKEILKSYIISYFLDDILTHIFVTLFKSKRLTIVDELLNKYHTQLMSNINSLHKSDYVN